MPLKDMEMRQSEFGTMGKEGEDKSPVEGRVQQTSRENLVQKLPNELKEMLIDNLQSEDLRETAKNIQNFRLTSKENNRFILKTPSVRRVQDNLNELRSLTETLRSAVLKDGLSPHQTEIYDDPFEMGPLPARAQVQALVSTLVLQSPAEKRELAREVLNLENDVARAEAIATLSPHFEHFSREDRSLLMNDAIKILADRGHPLDSQALSDFGPDGYSINEEGKLEAAIAIVEARAGGYLTDEHEASIALVTSCWGEAHDLIVQEANIRQEQLSRAAAEEARGGTTAPMAHLNEDTMKDLRRRLDRAASDEVRHQDPEGDPHGHGQMHALRDTAQAIGAAANTLSSELDIRSRKRSARSV
jgi:hypothetical protein